MKTTYSLKENLKLDQRRPPVCRLRPSAALIQARAVNLHLAQTQELLRVRDDDVDVATVRSLTVELGLAACWDICDHSAPVRGSRREELQVFTKSHKQMNLIV